MDTWQNHSLKITPGKLINTKNNLPSYHHLFELNEHRGVEMVR